MKLGVIGGSGLYDLPGLEDVEYIECNTPFGSPSDRLLKGRLGSGDLVFLPRHGRGHRLLPSEINHRANIFALKSLEVERVLSVSAVGSLKEEHRPRDIVLPDQYFDRTKAAGTHTFFGRGVVAHIGFSEPACAELRDIAAGAARSVAARSGNDVRVAAGGTYVNMEGPAFSTKAESEFYRSLGFDIIGMTSLPEAKLCREAEICYQALAMVTDYDCWHETEEAVSVEKVIEHLVANTELARAILAEIVALAPSERGCTCREALKNAILTDADAIDDETRKRLAPIIGKYV